jgi:hypothetical protein
MYFISLYVFLALRENIEMAGALAVIRIGPPSQEGFYVPLLRTQGF